MAFFSWSVSVSIEVSGWGGLALGLDIHQAGHHNCRTTANPLSGEPYSAPSCSTLRGPLGNIPPMKAPGIATRAAPIITPRIALPVQS